MEFMPGPRSRTTPARRAIRELTSPNRARPAAVSPDELKQLRFELLKEPLYALAQVLYSIHRLTPDEARACLMRAEVLNAARPIAKPQGKAGPRPVPKAKARA